MHPSATIRGTRSHLLEGQRIVVGVSGSIAATEVVRVVRELVRHGADVVAVASHEATRIVSAEALQFATGHPTVTELTGAVEHVVLFTPGKERADLLLLAPATANTLAKVAHGIDDTPVTTCASMALGNGIPVMVAPAMHAAMANNPFVTGNLKALKAQGIEIIPPLHEEGEAKLATPETVTAHVLHRLASGPWAGKRVLVLGGSTSEPIDDVRSVTNGGSGRMAADMAAQLFYRGANVTLWMGECRVALPSFLEIGRFRTTTDLGARVTREAKTLRKMDAVLVPAALSDFTVKDRRRGKVDSSSTASLTVNLVRTPKFLPRLRKLLPTSAMLVGFKLEPGEKRENLVKEAEALLEADTLDAVVANGVSSMGSVSTRLYLVRKDQEVVELNGDKFTVAGKLLDALAGGIA